MFDLQNSARTYFYRKFILKNLNGHLQRKHWTRQKKKILIRRSSAKNGNTVKNRIETKYLKTIDLSWANSDISKLLKYTNDEFILIFPFCSKNI